MGQFTIAVLGGDGIGPEVTDEAARVLTAIGKRYHHTIHLTPALVGQAAIEAEGAAISDATMALCQRSDAISSGRSAARAWDDRTPKRSRRARCFGCVKNWNSSPTCAQSVHSPRCGRLRHQARGAARRGHAGGARTDRRPLLRQAQ